MKPPISYYGGKQRIASKIVSLIPKHTVYVEPFCGGAAVMFAKPWPDVSNNNHYREVINDTDGRLINFYTQLRNNGEELCRRLSLALYSEREYQTAKQIEHDDPVESARRYYVNIMQSFSHVLGGGWRRGVIGENVAATWINSVARLPEYLERMSSIHISCTDALKCIKQWDSPQTFFYCDPPYPKSQQGHYSGYSVADFDALISTLVNIKGSALVSCYDHGLTVPDGWERHEIAAHCSASGKGKVNADRSRKATAEELGDRKRTEILLYKPADKPRDEIQRLYDSGKFDCFGGE